MAKFCGKLGYSINEEVYEDYFEPVIKERTYYGDIISIRRDTRDSANGNNDDILLNSKLSIISDPFAKQNINCLKYAVINGVAWKVTNVDINYPRMNIDLGGVYNGPRPTN